MLVKKGDTGRRNRLWGRPLILDPYDVRVPFLGQQKSHLGRWTAIFVGAAHTTRLGVIMGGIFSSYKTSGMIFNVPFPVCHH